jgi:hypothetical protein
VRHCLLHRAAGIELGAKIRKRDSVVARELRKTGFNRGERLGIAQDLRRLLEGVVLVDWDQRKGWLSVAGHQYVIATIGDIAQDATEIGPDSRAGTVFATADVPHCVRILSSSIETISPDRMPLE